MRALKDNRPEPLKLNLPIQLTYTLYKTDMIDGKLRGRTDLERIGGRTVAMTVERQQDILLIL